MWYKRYRHVVWCLVLLCLATMGNMMIGTVVAAAEQVQGDFVYELSEDGQTAILVRYDGQGGTVTVPALLGGKTVKKIGQKAFYGCAELTNLILPDGITEIGESAFWYCAGLSSVQWPSNLQTIGKYAFFNCTALTEAVLPDTTENIGNWAFSGCSSLSLITLPENVRVVGNGAFDNTKWYDRQPDGDVVIGHCYYQYKGVMPDNHTVTMGKNITVVADGAFSERETLAAVHWPDGLKRIGSNLFYHCRRLTSVTIPESVTEIGDSAFAGCETLKSVILPEGVLLVGDKAFSECTALKAIVLSEHLQKIGQDGFTGCVKLSDVIYIGIQEQFNGIEMDGSTKQKLSNKLILADSRQELIIDSSGFPTVPDKPEESDGQPSRRSRDAVIREENKVWTVVIIVGLAFIGVMVIAFIVRAIVSRKKKNAAILSGTVSQEIQFPRWRNAPSEQKEDKPSEK